MAASATSVIGHSSGCVGPEPTCRVQGWDAAPESAPSQSLTQLEPLQASLTGRVISGARLNAFRVIYTMARAAKMRIPFNRAPAAARKAPKKAAPKKVAPKKAAPKKAAPKKCASEQRRQCCQALRSCRDELPHGRMR